SWAIQLITEGKDAPDDARRRFETLAKRDTSALVRLYLASALQRMAPEQRWDIVKNLSMHEADVADQNIPLMVWYALEPLVGMTANRARDSANNAKFPGLAYLVPRRIAVNKN